MEVLGQRLGFECNLCADKLHSDQARKAHGKINFHTGDENAMSRCKEEEIIFDTMREADVWADSIANEMYGRLYDSYSTPDYKIAYALAFRLAAIENCRVYTKDENAENKYKVYAAFDDSNS